MLGDKKENSIDFFHKKRMVWVCWVKVCNFLKGFFLKFSENIFYFRIGFLRFETEKTVNEERITEKKEKTNMSVRRDKILEFWMKNLHFCEENDKKSYPKLSKVSLRFHKKFQTLFHCFYFEKISTLNFFR